MWWGRGGKWGLVIQPQVSTPSMGLSRLGEFHCLPLLVGLSSGPLQGLVEVIRRKEVQMGGVYCRSS